MKKRYIFLILFVLVAIVAAIVFVKYLQIATLIDTGKSFKQPPTTISAMNVKPYEWESTLKAIGSLEAAKGLVLTADLSGRITRINFDAGNEVTEGDLLIEQETSAEKAQLRSAKSAAALARSNFERTKQLLDRKVASQSEYDNANSAYKTAVANVDNILAAIEKKSIRAPFSGRLGIRLVNLGQSINAGEPVVSLQAADQMFVNFFLPQQDLPKLATGLLIRLRSDAVPGKTFTGKINAINPEIDSATRSVEIQAILANPEKELLPGMFANIEVVLPDIRSVLLIPITAVQYATYGDSVFIIEEADLEKNDGQTAHSGTQKEAQESAQPLKARQQFVRLGKTRGDYVIVEKGLKVGDKVASAGVFKLRNGAPVIINNTVVPDFSLTPSLADQ